MGGIRAIISSGQEIAKDKQMDKQVEINHVPNAPGCYIFWDNVGDCLYVGKSKRVKTRVQSYFNKNNPPKIIKLAKLISRVEYRPANNELDALFLEHGLIKTYRPPFNSQMKKDPHPYYICIEWQWDRPGLYISDRPPPGATRYGSFGSAYDAKDALALINRAWRTPMCEKSHFDKAEGRACLNQHIGRCLAPCQEQANRYRDNLISAAAYMQGRGKKVLLKFEQEMKTAAQNMDYEKAGKLRDMLESLRYLQKRFTYRVPFQGRRLCVFMRGYHETGFLILYYKNSQLLQAARFESIEDWIMGQDEFVCGMLEGKPPELAKLYTTAATQEIRARKRFVDLTKTRKDDIAKRLSRALDNTPEHF